MLNLPTDLPISFKYKIGVSLFAGSWHYNFSLIGARGGVNLHVSGPHNYGGVDHFSAGLEFHHRQPIHDSDYPPSHDECWLLKCPCWHDGTSLYAQEEYLPRVLSGDYEGVFRRLVLDAKDRFAPKCEEVE